MSLGLGLLCRAPLVQWSPEFPALHDHPIKRLKSSYFAQHCRLYAQMHFQAVTFGPTGPMMPIFPWNTNVQTPTATEFLLLMDVKLYFLHLLSRLSAKTLDTLNADAICALQNKFNLAQTLCIFGRLFRENNVNSHLFPSLTRRTWDAIDADWTGQPGNTLRRFRRVSARKRKKI